MSRGLFPFVLRRLLWLPVILFLVSLIVFALGRYGPGDPVQIRAGSKADPEQVQFIRQQLGLEDPFLVQYWHYISGVVRGDLGESLAQPGFTVAELIGHPMWVSSQLGLVALSIVFLVGIPAGVLAALKQGSWADPFIISVFLFFQSVPVLISIPFMMWLFSLKLDWLPAAGWEGIFDKHIVIPALALSLPGVAGVARLMRISTLVVLDEDYVRTARAKGLREFTVMSRHIARNALLPMTTVIGLSLATLVEGAFFAEFFYGIPGIGRVAVKAVFDRDYEVITALTLIGVAAFVVANIAVDITYSFIDPRVRLQGEGRS